MLDLNFDSTPILTWLDRARAKNELSPTDLRRSLIARMIWKVSYQRSIGLIENVRFLLGSRVWGDRPRAVLAEDILVLRRALAEVGQHLAYSRQPEMEGFYLRGRPLIDPQMKRRMIGAMAEVDPVQMAILHRMTIAERIEQALSMIETAEGVGVRRLRLRQPQLSEEQAYYLISEQPKHMSDIKSILEAMGDKLDYAYMSQWIHHFNLSSAWRQAQEWNESQ